MKANCLDESFLIIKMQINDFKNNFVNQDEIIRQQILIICDNFFKSIEQVKNTIFPAIQQYSLSTGDQNETDQSLEKKIIDKKLEKSSKLYSNEIKSEVFRMLQTMTIYDVQKMTGIKVRTLKRWKQNGISRRKFAGRRSLAPEMEDSLCKWINEMKIIKNKISKKDIISKALQLCNKEFKASKGWYEKFLRRNKEKLNENSLQKSTEHAGLLSDPSKDEKLNLLDFYYI